MTDITLRETDGARGLPGRVRTEEVRSWRRQQLLIATTRDSAGLSESQIDVSALASAMPKPPWTALASLAVEGFRAAHP
jgi:hypothetical protein